VESGENGATLNPFKSFRPQFVYLGVTPAQGIDLSPSVNPFTGRIASQSAGGVETLDARMLVVARCALAFTALVTWIPASEHGRWIALAYPSLLVYCVCSVMIGLNSYRLVRPGFRLTPYRLVYTLV
jgi:hypothetical protein